MEFNVSPIFPLVKPAFCFLSWTFCYRYHFKIIFQELARSTFRIISSNFYVSALSIQIFPYQLLNGISRFVWFYRNGFEHYLQYNFMYCLDQHAAATKIVAVAKGYLVRRLMRTDRVQSTVQTIKDALLCALQLHQDREGIRGADVDLHRRLIQQVGARCGVALFRVHWFYILKSSSVI